MHPPVFVMVGLVLLGYVAYGPAETPGTMVTVNVRPCGELAFTGVDYRPVPQRMVARACCGNWVASARFGQAERVRLADLVLPTAT